MLKHVSLILLQMIVRVGVAIPLKVVQMLFDVSSPLFTLRHTNDNEVSSTQSRSYPEKRKEFIKHISNVVTIVCIDFSLFSFHARSIRCC